uniref:Uncharacterized protein n=1 Tax=Arundo donax TaxID=35708 RepID=A0A0A9GGV7_ARUDO
MLLVAAIPSLWVECWILFVCPACLSPPCLIIAKSLCSLWPFCPFSIRRSRWLESESRIHCRMSMLVRTSAVMCLHSIVLTVVELLEESYLFDRDLSCP